MNNKEFQAETNAQQSTKDEGIMSCHTIGKPNVVCCFSTFKIKPV